VLFVAVQLDFVVEREHFAIHARAHKAGLADFLQYCLVGAFPFAHHRRQDQEAAAFRQREDGIHDFLRGLALDRPAADRAVGNAHAGEQQAQVVVDFRDRADRGAGVVRGALLVDGNGRREAFDGVHVGFVHLPEELAGVSGERFHIAALTFGEDRVECQRGFAGTGQAGQDDQFVARDFHGDIFEVVFARADDAQVI